MEAMKAKHEALLREQATQREKAMKAQEELLKKQRLETEKVRAQLERMAVEEAESSAVRVLAEKEQASKKQTLQVRHIQEVQMNLFSLAAKAGLVKAKVSQDWRWWIERICDHCGQSCGVGVSYIKGPEDSELTSYQRVNFTTTSMSAGVALRMVSAASMRVTPGSQDGAWSVPRPGNADVLWVHPSRRRYRVTAAAHQ
ncbi:hypothetical protein LTS09_006595 [Friedmanniomyces endolithicus]|nr:hypothetical protein LTS09_006595 [Friedmanniomyces endolithicus]